MKEFLCDDLFLMIMCVLLLAGIGMYLLLREEKKIADSNTFYQKTNPERKVRFIRSITRLDEDFISELYVEFVRLDNQEHYVMKYEDFEKNFIRKKDYEITQVKNLTNPI